MDSTTLDIFEMIANSKDPRKAFQIALYLARKLIESKGSSDNG